MNKIYNIIFAVGIVLFSTFFSSCEDTLEYNVNNIREGESEVEIEANFRKFTPALNSRSAGTSLDRIEDLVIFIYNTDGSPCYINNAAGEPEFPLHIGVLNPEETDNTTDCRVSFKMTLPNGAYRMYALANMELEEDADFSTEEKLFKIATPEWDTKDVTNNAEMFGRFDSNVEPEDPNIYNHGELAPTVVVNGRTNLHVWLRRCASKVTLEYDGTGLYPGVSIYLMSAAIKDIPAVCAIGMDNTVENVNALIPEGEVFDYYDGEKVPTVADLQSGVGTIITKDKIWPENAHDNDADALFFYENMQGVHEDIDKRQKDTDKDGVLDYEFKDGINCGTYIEVEAVYFADIPEQNYKSSGLIKYRFMLGKNIINDFDAERNYHYKLTLKFKNRGNDVDWHIDYAEQVLGVTQPKVFNYQGKVFVPKPSVANLDHNFAYENTVKLTSYMTDDMNKVYPYTIEYKPDGGTYSSTPPNWLIVEDNPSVNPYDRQVTFKVDQSSIVREKFVINELLSKKTQVGNASKPYNLANPSQTSVDPKLATIKNTANCYMISAPGYYILPLVYGNAIENFNPVTTAYNPGITGSNVLSHFKDYLGNDIKSPYINKSGTPKHGILVWQDEDNLVDFINWHGRNADVKYIPEAYGGVGGLQFYVPVAKEGNAVIGVTDIADFDFNSILLHDGFPRLMWSWHIWVTCFDGFKDDQTIEVKGHEPDTKYDFMPVNLGWCSEDGQITHYPERSCDVKFKAGDKERVITIVQKSHIAVPRGNSTYYQWGRKDPFFGTTARSNYVSDLNDTNADLRNKYYYYSKGWGNQANPPRLTTDLPVTDLTLDKARKKTKDVINILIQKPYIWQNPPRTDLTPDQPDPTKKSWASNDQIYFNLWDGLNGVESMEAPSKTIYDPCPYGYQVPHHKAFSGFTVTGEDASESTLWYDVRSTNILDYNNSKQWVFNTDYDEQLYEFYTSPDKCQSIVFPQVGYRDWDSFAYIYKIGPTRSIGYAWSAHIYNNDHNMAYNFEFTRDDLSENRDRRYIRPLNPFYPCDGFPVRPCKQPGK